MALNIAKIIAEANARIGIATQASTEKKAAEPAKKLTGAEILARAKAARTADQISSLQKKLVNDGPMPLPAGKSVVGESLLRYGEGTLEEKYRFSVGMDGSVIELNDKQLSAVALGASGKDCVVIGAAGSGKTTTQRALVQALAQSGNIPTMLNVNDHKYLKTGTPGIVICSFTRRAVNNIRAIMPAEFKDNCITIHKLLEYQPTDILTDEVLANGSLKTKTQFLPNRDEHNPLPTGIRTIIIEESGMCSLELFQILLNALKHEVQFIFLGDIYQLPPPMGSAILGYKMAELPTIELDKVYRNTSHILSFANDIKDGLVIPGLKKKEGLGFSYPKLAEMKEKTDGMINLIPFRNKIGNTSAVNYIELFFKKMLDDGQYDPENDIILCPFDREFSQSTHDLLVSCIPINKLIAQHLSTRRGQPTYEICAGRFMQYFAIGDRVLYDKMDAIITDIRPNPKYFGKPVRKPSLHLNRSGINTDGDDSLDFGGMDAGSGDMLTSISSLTEMFSETSDGTNAASHIITIYKEDSESEEELTTAGQVNSVALGYAITVYKSQGCEWKRVFCILHHSHDVQLYNETLYTAVTRAREKLIVICEGDTFETGVKRRKVKGKTLAEKAEFFKGKQERMQSGLPENLKKAMEAARACRSMKVSAELEKMEAPISPF